MALAAAKEASTETVAKLFALLDVNIANAEEVRKLRDAIVFLYGIKRTAETARHRFYITLLTIVSGGIILAAYQATWSYLRAKLQLH